ncbi:hypothetical protein DU500_16240 [Haloplanus rubicundus]|uniref:Big-1 domain-containing protein n=1 Tax=Haloplanus rubicundus TaxID=1547898 RepID=A0A345E6M9_9EURY|nr:hypothetical protein [Haloplanus rubicundus]AXG07851.1 hypothetical protein DU500_16240 [Haloplanus rubicundus]
MGFRDANRAQAIQVGAILLFALLILGISIYQATVVPQQNARVEFNAYQEATDDMVSVRDDVVTAGTEGTAASTTVETGATYPARSIFINPGAPSGTVSTASASNVTVSGVRPVDSEASNTRAFWNETSGTYETNRVTFTPSYNEFDGSPVAIAGQGVYRLPEGRVLPISAGSTISANRITLVTVRGDLGASGRSVSVTADPVSTATRTVVVTGTGGTFNVTVPTPVPASAWNDTVAPDVVANPNVRTTDPVGDDSVRIEFNGSRRYELRLAAVELRAQSDSSTVQQPDGSYLIGLTGNETISTNGTSPIAVEVRDRYNNPVSGADVTFNVTSGDATFAGGGTGRVVTTDGSGRAPVALRPGGSGTITVEAKSDLNGNGTIESYERTRFAVTATDGSDDQGGAEEINPAEEGDVVLESGETQQSSNKDEITIRFNNTADGDRTITEARLSFYYASGSNDNPPESITIGGTDLSVPSRLTQLDSTLTLAPGTGQTITLTANMGSGVPVPGDFLVLSLVFEETGDVNTYFVTLEKA